MKRLTVLLAVLALLPFTPSAVAASPNVGQHIHVEIASFPVDGVVIPRAPYTFQVTLRAHDQTGTVTSFRVSDYSTVKRTVKVALGPCADCSVTFPFTVDFAKWSCGRHELRWTANVPDNDEGKRQFTTSRAFVTLAGCSTDRTGRKGWFGGGGGWYEGNDYAIAVLLSPDSTIRPGGTISVRVQSSADRGCVFLNPDFHHGSHGTQLRCWTGQGAQSVAIPASAAVGDRLLLYASDGQNAGLAGFTLGTGSRTTAPVQWQAWWRREGIVLP